MSEDRKDRKADGDGGAPTPAHDGPLTAETGQVLDRDDVSGQFAKGNQFAKRRHSAPRKITLLRRMLDEAIVRAGGQEFVNEFIRKYPIEAMKIRAMLEPKDIRLDVESRSVRIVMFAEAPTNGKALPAEGRKALPAEVPEVLAEVSEVTP